MNRCEQIESCLFFFPYKVRTFSMSKLKFPGERLTAVYEEIFTRTHVVCTFYKGSFEIRHNTSIVADETVGMGCICCVFVFGKTEYRDPYGSGNVHYCQ